MLYKTFVIGKDFKKGMEKTKDLSRDPGPSVIVTCYLKNFIFK